MVKSSKRERAIAVPQAGVGETRYLLYKRAWERINAATAAGFYLEAITLLESILADRMESRASFLTGENVGYKTLGFLVDTLRKYETVPDFLSIIERIDAWRNHRNIALHEMVKFQIGEHPSWEEKVGPLPTIVREGKVVLRAFDGVDQRERRKNGARPAATEPAAFSDSDAEQVT